jgi:urate oxidase
MKTSRSAFADFPRDEFTTLPETRDRLLATALTATWSYSESDVEFGCGLPYGAIVAARRLRAHDSLSVQHTLYAMAEVVLETIDVVNSISLEMPNRHHLPIDLDPLRAWRIATRSSWRPRSRSG